MPLILRSQADYYTGEGITRRCRDAQDYILALKGEQPKGVYAWLPLPSGKTLQITRENTAPAKEVLAAWALNEMRDLAAGTIIAIPPRSALVETAGELHRTDKLAEEIAKRSGGRFQIASVLRWRELVASTRDGGSRDASLIYKNAVLVPVAAGGRRGPVILFDDVVTSGGHLRACAAKLRSAGIDVSRAISAGRTISAPPPPNDPFAGRTETFDDYVP